MNAREELVARLARHRQEQLGSLSEGGYQELVRAVRENPASFVDSPEDQAFLLVMRALERHEAAQEGEDLLDDDAFFASRSKRMARLARDCEEALATDPACADAALLRILAQDLDPDPCLSLVLELERGLAEAVGKGLPGDSGDAWDDVFCRPRLRLHAALSRLYLDSARYRMAASACERLVELSPSDPIGARHTCALAYARLEDEPAFEALDVRFSRQGGAFEHLARTILLYKLGRMTAAKRALVGYASLCEGGAYALLKPSMVDTYLPDRPAVPPLGYAEASQAVNEADPIIMDVPDFVGWAQGQRDVHFSAQSFAERNDLDW